MYSYCTKLILRYIHNFAWITFQRCWVKLTSRWSKVFPNLSKKSRIIDLAGPTLKPKFLKNIGPSNSKITTSSAPSLTLFPEPRRRFLATLLPIFFNRFFSSFFDSFPMKSIFIFLNFLLRNPRPSTLQSVSSTENITQTYTEYIFNI